MHSFTNCLMHCVWATKERRPLIKPALQERLWPYLGGIARESKMKALAIGGVEDHVHALLSLPSTLSIAKAIQLLKGNSSKWSHETFAEQWDFDWQEGYGAFSIGISGVEDTTKYIAGQAEHHRKLSFREELQAFLDKHGMEYVERDLDSCKAGLISGRRSLVAHTQCIRQLVNECIDYSVIPIHIPHAAFRIQSPARDDRK